MKFYITYFHKEGASPEGLTLIPIECKDINAAKATAVSMRTSILNDKRLEEKKLAHICNDERLILCTLNLVDGTISE